MIVLLGFPIIHSCSNYKYVDENTFVGTWELKGRKMYSGMTVRIEKESDKLKGYIISPPENRYGKLFIETGQVWITQITRGANYYFKLTEQKIANELFTQYDINVNSTFFVTFSEAKDKIYLTQKRPNKFIEKSDIYYERIQ